MALSSQNEGFLKEKLQARRYKPSQHRVRRQLTGIFSQEKNYRKPNTFGHSPSTVGDFDGLSLCFSYSLASSLPTLEGRE